MVGEWLMRVLRVAGKRWKSGEKRGKERRRGDVTIAVHSVQPIHPLQLCGFWYPSRLRVGGMLDAWRLCARLGEATRGVCMEPLR